MPFTTTDAIATSLIGRSEAMREVERDALAAARCDAKVLITGETGVGKEVIARLIHQHSARSRQGLVTLNCGGVPDTLLESELFGHARGSFTDAIRDKPGLLELAPHGTVFLDEVGEMSQRMQSLLLRFLESGEVQRIGADRAHARVNVRLVAATNRDLPAAMRDGTFRSDLYFRLNVIRIAVPPLRARTEDIPVLFAHFISVFSRQHGIPEPVVTTEIHDLLRGYSWPGNVRELRNVAERLVLRAHHGVIRAGDLPFDALLQSAPNVRVRVACDAEVRAAALVADMIDQGQSFWTVVHERFMSRDLTRADLRAVIRQGLALTRGSYRTLVARFNMPGRDYKKFLQFLRAHDCHVSFQSFRASAVQRPTQTHELRPSA